MTGSDNGLSTVQRQANIKINADFDFNSTLKNSFLRNLNQNENVHSRKYV